MSGIEGFFDNFLKGPSYAEKIEGDVNQKCPMVSENEVDQHDFLNNTESSQSYDSHTDHSKQSMTSFSSLLEDCSYNFDHQGSQSTSEGMPSSEIPAPVSNDTYEQSQKLGEPGCSGIGFLNETNCVPESDISIHKNQMENQCGSEIDEVTEDNEYEVSDSRTFPKKITRNPDAKLTRKRLINKSEWKSKKAKKAKLAGKEGESKCGKPSTPAKMGIGCGPCHFGCQKKITTEQRKLIFNEFWNLKNHNRQWDYINKFTETKTMEDSNRKNVSIKYYLKVSYKTIKVCQTMFNHTLGISGSWIRTINKKTDMKRGALEPDQRGKHLNRPSRVDAAVKQSVRDHIESFPAVESHYCRQTTNKTYLESGLSLRAMFEKYTVQMKEMKKECASEHVYREIFSTEYNIAFHQPKKDLCDLCNAYSYLSEEAKMEQAKEYDLHLENKIAARRLMAEDKKQAESYANICAACFDVEQTLTTPRGYNSTMYYKRKVNIYNFTVYELATHQGSCYVWNETVAGKGANKISSCLWSFIKKKAESGVDDFRFYSDNCGAQNRNKMLYSMYVRASTLLKVKIQDRYLEKGHIYNEGDSMHATIEYSCKNKAVFTQTQWCDIMRNAKKNEPFYIVNEFLQKDILNFRPLAEDQNWKAIKISNLREIVVCRDKTNVSVKYEYDERPTSILIATKKCIGKKYPLTQLHTSKIPLDKEKKNDLQKICYIDKVIPEEFHSFYKSLLK